MIITHRPNRMGVWHRTRSRAMLGLLVIVALGVSLLLAITGGVHDQGASTMALTGDPHAVAGGLNADAIAIDPQRGRAVVTTGGRAPGQVPGTASLVDVRTHKIVHTLPIGVAPHALVVDARDHRAFVINGAQSGGSSVSVLDTKTAVFLQTLHLSGMAAGLAVDGRQGHLFVSTTLRNEVAMYDAQTGTFLRRMAVGDGPGALAVEERSGHAFVVNTGSGTVSMLDTRTGRVVRTTAVGQAPIRVVCDARTGHVFVANVIGKSVAMLDVRTGRLLGMTALGGVPKDMAVDARNGHVFVITQSADVTGPGSVSMLSATSGQLLRTIPVGPFPVALAVDEWRDMVVVVTGGRLAHDGTPLSRGQVHILDARTGSPLQTHAVGIVSNALAIDEQAGQMFVVNGGAQFSVSTPDRWGWMPARLRRLLPFLPARTSHTEWVQGSISILSLPPVRSPHTRAVQG